MGEVKAKGCTKQPRPKGYSTATARAKALMIAAMLIVTSTFGVL